MWLVLANDAWTEVTYTSSRIPEAGVSPPPFPHTPFPATTSPRTLLTERPSSSPIQEEADFHPTWWIIIMRNKPFVLLNHFDFGITLLYYCYIFNVPLYSFYPKCTHKMLWVRDRFLSKFFRVSSKCLRPHVIVPLEWHTENHVSYPM